MKLYIHVDIGCLECGEDSQVVGVFKTREEAEDSCLTYITDEPNQRGRSWGRAEWRGQHEQKIFQVDINGIQKS